ncbi:MAG: DUF523 domain-containing protein [Lachnospiraceae bacterium]|nr:DUF523 domain-containing protein [Lachnospiraceae bacterium]
MKVLVSACLLGVKCKYNGGDNANERLRVFLEGCEAVPVCPETAGGLPVPRCPAEIVGGVVMNAAGENVDAAFRRGAEACLETAVRTEADLAVLQSRSPSCGVGQVYDGTFSGTLVPGNGVFAELLIRHGFRVVDVEALFGRD